MKTRLKIVGGLLAIAAAAFPHRLDEYLQAILLSLESDHVSASMRLIPGVAVANRVIAEIDLNGDTIFSESEQQAYARKVLNDLTLRLGDHKLTPRLGAVSFPTAAEMRQGLGEIHIDFTARLPNAASARSLVLENHHESRLSVYLMNCLVPQDSSLRILEQKRNQNQSWYQVDYQQAAAQFTWPVRARLYLSSTLALFAAVPDMFRLGVRHISEGTDHLLFLLALLLPAPLLATRTRWTERGESARRSLLQIVRVVTAFTVGHSLTLALGATGIVSLPARLVEVLIAFSILLSALHALRPLFPGREPLVAALFGLVHGLAFAKTLQDLGTTPWQRVAAILGFNLGIEAMQLLVVAAILPSLLLLSRTPAYTPLRAAGAIFAGVASLGWITERTFGISLEIDAVVGQVAHHAGWLAGLLVAVSVVMRYAWPPACVSITRPQN